MKGWGALAVVVALAGCLSSESDEGGTTIVGRDGGGGGAVGGGAVGGGAVGGGAVGGGAVGGGGAPEGGADGSGAGGVPGGGGPGGGGPGGGGPGGGGPGGGGPDGGGPGGGGPGGGGAAIEGRFCQEVCARDADCLDGWRCDDARCWPESGNGQCAEDIDCVPLFSGWQMGCGRTLDCDGGMAGTQACIEWEGQGLCAFVEGEFIDCETLQMNRRVLPLAEGGEVVACVRDAVICTEDRYCTQPCDVVGCPSPEYPICDPDTRRCRCGPGSCRTNASVCGDDGVCRCQRDADCTTDAVDTCYDGFCGCSDGAICPADTAHPGTRWACEPFEGGN